ncbi:hypothetical protein D9M69_328550 [compost metagenome]
MNNLTLINLVAITLTGCTAAPETSKAIPPLPTCSQILPILMDASSEFKNLRTGPRVIERSHSQGRWASTVSLPGADECIVRENYSMGYKYRCSWGHEGDRASMGQHYQALRDRIISCVGDVRVYRNDIKGYTIIDLEPTGLLDKLQYGIRAKYEYQPYKVYFDVDAH